MTPPFEQMYYPVMHSDEYPLVKRWNGRYWEWVESEPDSCPNGHPWPGNLSRGSRSCPEHDGHRVWHCTVCAVEVLNPRHEGEFVKPERWKIFG